MDAWPDNACLYCDMPWKNNRVEYTDQPLCAPHRAAAFGALACLSLGHVSVSTYADGRVTLRDQNGWLLKTTGLGKPMSATSLAADTALRLVYVSAGESLFALRPEEGLIVWERTLRGTAASPMLYELAKGAPAVCVGDDAGFLSVYDRRDGGALWRAELGFKVKAVPSHRNGLLVIPCEGLLACLDAATGDAVWAVPAQTTQGVLKGDVYHMGLRRFSLFDGAEYL